MPLFALDAPLRPGDTATAPIEVDGRRYDRIVVCTEWIGPDDDLEALLTAEVGPLLLDGDLVAVSEKAVVVATGRAVPAHRVRVGRLAAAVAARVQPVGDSRGLSVPEKVQLLIDLRGTGRVLLAAAASAVTRPLGVRGAFYVVAGATARGIDGMRPPYLDTLLPPLTRRQATAEARRLAAAVGGPVAIVDINDRGGSVRAVAGTEVRPRRLARILADNPLGQRTQATPIVIVRPARSDEAAETA